MIILKWIVVLAGGGYFAFVAFLYVAQRRFVFHPQSAHPSPAAVGLPEAEEVALDTADGARVIVWQVPPRGEKPVVIYFHGNAEIVASRAKRHRQLTADGIGLVALSYRGYMSSTGSPTEDGLLHDAEAAYRFATARFPSSPVVLWGHSLGTGVAVALASRHPVAKVILEASFSSTADVAAGVFPFVPVRWLMRDQFRSDQRIGVVRAPLLIMHGARDWVVPIALGERLFALAREPKRFVRFPDGGHDDLDQYGASAEVQCFIAESSQ
jgi:pimeloyl-ACP methyl ester carboxylesterase